jgi:predicted transposase/invertase (TIGR01784 family)
MNYKYISPLNDVVFSHVFGEQRNIENTRDFLMMLLDIPVDEYERLTVKNSVLKPSFIRGKTGIVDVLLTTKSGKIIHIEMQVNKAPNLRSRILYYATRIFDRQLKKGNDFGKLHQVISIMICDHILLEEESSYLNVYELRNVYNNRFTDLLQVVIIELPKVPDTADGQLWPWLKFFKCTSVEEFNMLTKNHPKLKKAVDCTQRMSFFEKLDWALFDLEMRKRDEREWKQYVREEAIAEGIAEGRAKGLAEGIAEGIAEGRAEGRVEGLEQGLQQAREDAYQEKLKIALKMKNRGQPITEIAEIIGLPPGILEKL